MGRKPFTPTLTPEEIEKKSIMKQELLKLLFQPDFISLEEKIFYKGWEDKIEHYFRVHLNDEIKIPKGSNYKNKYEKLSSLVKKISELNDKLIKELEEEKKLLTK